MITQSVRAWEGRNAMADSLMDDISLFMEDNTETEVIDEEREIR